jgi:lactam utilization protein B
VTHQLFVGAGVEQVNDGRLVCRSRTGSHVRHQNNISENTSENISKSTIRAHVKLHIKRETISELYSKQRSQH